MLQEMSRVLHPGRRVKLVALVTFASQERRNAVVTNHVQNAYQEAGYACTKQSILAACLLRLRRRLMSANCSRQTIADVLQPADSPYLKVRRSCRTLV